MIIDFNDMDEIIVPGMNDGTGTVSAKMHMSENGKIIPTRIHPGGSIGMYRQDSGDDINYVISGRGKAICNGAEEELKAGVCHICHKGAEHSIINTGDEDLVLLTIVVHK